MLAWMRADGPRPLTRSRRLAGKRHDSVVIVYPDAWIFTLLARVQTPMRDGIRALVEGPIPEEPWVTVPLGPEDRAWAQGFMAPHLCEAARRMLDEARLTEFLLRKAFGASAEPEATISRARRLAEERIGRVKAALEARLDDPPALEVLARLAGCHPHYLSRTFSQIEGVSMSLWLRSRRIERAAGLLSAGRCNVSEAAVEVGYRSLSHFSRAFFEEKGVSPSKWVESRRGGR